jgi:hypothetical protein
LLGWIGFGVPDWHRFQRFEGSINEYYGLWAYCQEQLPLYDTVCQRWGAASTQVFNGSRPNFISTAQGLITTGMILLSLGLIAGIAATILPLLAYLAAVLAFIAFIFLVIGLPIFGRQSNDYSVTRGDYSYGKRYGFWLIVPTIVLEFIAAALFVGAGNRYQKDGYGNIATGSGNQSANKAMGGQRMLGPANMYPPFPSYGMRPPYGGGMQGPPIARPEPSLLSQYLTQRVTPAYDQPSGAPRIASVLPQPSIVRATGVGVGQNSLPAYYRFGEPVGPPFKPIINLSGETIVGPLVRTA